MTTTGPTTVSQFNALFRVSHPTKGVTNRIVEPNSVTASSSKLLTVIHEHIRSVRANSADYSSVSAVADLTVMEVPPNFHSSGNNVQNLLKQIDEEYNVLSGFVQANSSINTSFVVIVGQLRPRRAAELKIMATIENKQRGFYSDRLVRDNKKVLDRPWYVDTETFDTDSFPIPEKDLSFALGQRGSIRKKLAVAANCIMEYVGFVAYMSGTLFERNMARDYLRWVLQQLEGEVQTGPDLSLRQDVSSMVLTKRAAGFVNGNKGRVLRTVEEVTGTFCFVGAANVNGTKPLLVCGSENGRKAAVFIFEKYIKQNQGNDWGGDAVSASADVSRESVHELLVDSGISLQPPVDPWKCGSNDPGNYRYICQPCPGAARSDAVVLPVDAPSSCLLKSSFSMETTTVGSHTISKKKSTIFANPPSEYVNDDSAFPQLGGPGGVVVNTSSINTVVTSVQVASPLLSPRARDNVVEGPKEQEVPHPQDSACHETHNHSPRQQKQSERPGVFFNRDRSQVWGDWGLGPNGDSTAVIRVPKVVSVAPQLQGPWK